MKRGFTNNRHCAIVIALAAALAALIMGVARANAAGGAHYYLALGDSLARSAQPNGDYQHGYAEQLLAKLQQQDPSLRLEKLACGGATTTSMRYGSLDPSCAFPHKTQLAEAVAFLQAHRKFVSLVTVDVGADDLPDVGAIATNLPVILAELRAAAGPSVPIVGMNYYDPYLATIWLGGGSLSDLNAEIAFVTAFDSFLGNIYTAAADPIADVGSAFQVTETTLVDTDGNGTPDTPVDVLRECQWTWICVPPPLGPDVHANTAGYGVIAQAFLDVLP
jgi:lysophospholipase L1-like esterase